MEEKIKQILNLNYDGVLWHADFVYLSTAEVATWSFYDDTCGGSVLYLPFGDIPSKLLMLESSDQESESAGR